MTRSRILAALFLLSALAPRSGYTQASDPYLGQLMLGAWGGGQCPSGWATAEGQLLPISQNQSLFALLGTTYGGDGETSFALPDLRGRAPIHHGNGPGLSAYSMGQKVGAEIAPHTHTVGSNGATRPAGSLDLVSVSTGAPGGTTSHNTDVRAPRIAMTWCIAIAGIFPSF